MKHLLLLALLLASITAVPQINPEGTGAQVIGYWDNNEKQTYAFVHEKARVNQADTTVTETTTYKVDITILDSTATSYTVSWKYRDYIIKSGNAMSEKLTSLYDGLEIKFKTDEFGSFAELLNWEDIKKHNEAAFKMLEKDSSIAQNIIAVIKSTYSTREAIESHSIKDIIQFYGFHGTAFDVNETIEEEITEDNGFGNIPIKSNITVEIEDIDVENATYILRFWQSFSPESVNILLDSLFKELIGESTKGKIGDITIEDYSGVVMHDTGWPVEMYYERVVDIEGIQIVETRGITIE